MVAKGAHTPLLLLLSSSSLRIADWLVNIPLPWSGGLFPGVGGGEKASAGNALKVRVDSFYIARYWMSCPRSSFAKVVTNANVRARHLIWERPSLLDTERRFVVWNSVTLAIVVPLYGGNYEIFYLYMPFKWDTFFLFKIVFLKFLLNY